MTSFETVQLPVHYFGTPVALLSTEQPDGSTHLTPMSSLWALDDRYVLGLGTDSQGAVNLLRTGELVINLADVGMAPAVERIAPTTGAEQVPERKAGYTTERDKWRLGGLHPLPSERVRPQRVAECPVQVEATLEAVHPVVEGAASFHVRVRRVHLARDLVTPQGRVDTTRWVPLFYTFRHYFGQGAEVGRNFRADQ